MTGPAAVEHLFILIVEFARWLDRRFLRSLRAAVPDFDRLVRDPRGTLAGHRVTIRPARKYGSLILGVLVVLVLELVITAALLAGPGKRPGQRPPVQGFLVLGGMLAVLAGWAWVLARLLRGGRVVLTEHGVEFAYRRSVVFCPWALFNAPGQPFLPRRDVVLLPVAPAAIPFVEARRNDTVRAGGRPAGTPQFAFKSDTEAMLRPRCEVHLAELGGLLLRLGRALGETLPDGAPVPEAEPVPRPAARLPAVAERDGWITARLTRLVFPPFCCDCGAATDRVQQFRGYSSLVRLGRVVNLEGGEFATCWVPVCADCERANRRRARSSALRGALLGLGIPLAVSLGMALFLQDPTVLLMFFPLDIFGMLIGASVGRSRGLRRAAPVRLGRYSPGQGTIALRFRWPEYGERLLAFLEAQEDLPGEAAVGRPAVARSAAR